MSKKRGLLCGPGAARGAYQVGVFHSILKQEPGVKYDVFGGASTGAINAIAAAQYESFEEAAAVLHDLWLSINRSSVWRWTPLWVFRFLLSSGMVDTEPLKQLIRENIDHKKIASTGHQICISVSDLLTGVNEEITSVDELVPEWVIASSAYPPLFPASEGFGRLYTDGAVTRAAPIGAMIAAGCDEIDIVMTGPMSLPQLSERDLSNGVKVGLRVINMMAQAVWRGDLERCVRVNDRIACGHDRDPNHKVIKIRVFAPKKRFMVSDTAFVPEEIEAMFAAGCVAEPMTPEEFLLT